MTTSREFRLKSHPVGLPTPENFELATVELPDPAEGEVQVRNTWMSVDPVMRLQMMGGVSDMPGLKVGDTLFSGAIGEVISSNDPGFAVGDLVQSYSGWREAFNAPADTLQKLDPGPLPPQAFLGVAGMPGLTGYAGIIRVANLKEGDVVFVSSAAGAVGSLVCQIAKAKGHTVIGSAGGPEKCAYLKEIGVDHVIDYKDCEDLTAALLAAVPEGIDVYFDNVGGDHLEAALNAAKPNARIVLCGTISTLNATEMPSGPRNLVLAIPKQIRLQGVTVMANLDLLPDFIRDLGKWVQEGKVTWRETVFEGIEKAPEAFIGLFSGKGIGKFLVKLA